jgi:hypothetical protein
MTDARDANLFADEPLKCPGCGENYLHHIHVATFERREDETETIITEIADGHTTMGVEASMGCSNPSPRRHGLVITFECEHCNTKSQLALAQHKGQTFRAWRLKCVPARLIATTAAA